MMAVEQFLGAHPGSDGITPLFILGVQGMHMKSNKWKKEEKGVGEVIL
jgi:hypothetical protein